MTMLSNDGLTQLAFSLYENKGIFALLLGSGLSRAAEIPTGWEITVDLVRRVALAQGVEEQTDWAAWYREKTKQEPNYSTLLEELAASPDERRSILHRYIEPSPKEREEGKKTPTAAHHAIAKLVGGGYIRAIITTNFDRLMENALREEGIEPTIVASIDALAGAEPLTHSTCYLLKLHGDYKDARILNTESELSGYPGAYDALLDRIFDEHGLVVAGWSGEWDHALRAAILRTPNRRYSTFWTSRAKLGSGAQELVDQRRAKVISVIDADSFFTSLLQRVETLEQSQRQNPLSIELLLNSTKRFLAKPEFRIQLDELVTQQADRLIAQLDSDEFAIPAQWDQEFFRARVRKYEAACEGLATMAGALGRWGDGNEQALALDIIASLHAHAQKLSSGFTIHLALRTYPAVLVFVAYGLGLTRAARWPALHKLFHAKLYREHREAEEVVNALFGPGWSNGDDVAKQLEGLERHKTAASDHLLEVFSDWSKGFAGLQPSFELLFERFEMLASLTTLESTSMEDLQQTLSPSGRSDWLWMPIGRSGWHHAFAERLSAEFRTPPLQNELLAAGFSRGDAEFLALSLQNFARISARMRW
jgi:hypothetical protein